MSKWGWAARIGGYVLAPVTGGLSVPLGEAAARGIESKQHSNDGPDGKNKDDGDENPEDAFTSQLSASSQNLRGKASDLHESGSEALDPVLNYLKGILGDNPAAILDATRGDRGRVIDQYDTARKTIASFGPRGGGTNAALAGSQFDEAQSLADLTSDKRSEAVALSSQLGTALEGLGLSADQLASSDLNSVLNAVLAREGFDVAKRGQNMEALAGIGEAVGQIIAAKYGSGGGGGAGA